MKTTIFGATGFLGSHAAEQLALAGHEVVCVVRAGSKRAFLETLPVKIVTKNFDDVNDLASAIEAGGTVLNCIAETRMHLSDAERRKVEIELTSRVFLAAKQAKAKRFIQLSTVVIYGFDRPATAVDENYPVKPKYAYSRIAQEREQNLLALQKGTAIELLILRPSNTTGARDSGLLPALKQMIDKKAFAVIGGGQWKYSCIDARDVGRAMVHLLAVPVSGPEIFLVTGYELDNLTLKATVEGLLGIRMKLQNIPKGIGMALGWIMEKLTPYGKQPPLTRFLVEVTSTHTLFDDRKIRATGFAPKYDLLDSLSDAFGVSRPR